MRRHRQVTLDVVQSYDQMCQIMSAVMRESRGLLLELKSSSEVRMHAANRFSVLTQQALPEFGVVLPNPELCRDGTHPTLDVWLAINPLDDRGVTGPDSAMVFGPSMALIRNGQIVASCVGSVYNETIIGTTDEMDHVTVGGTVVTPRVLTSVPQTSDWEVMTYRPGRRMSKFAKRLQKRQVHGGSETLLKMCGYVWRDCDGALILPRGTYQSWDILPIMAISDALRMRLYPISAFTQLSYAARAFRVTRDPQTVTEEVVLAHADRFDDIVRWLDPNVLPDDPT